jgi:hypothetical protein
VLGAGVVKRSSLNVFGEKSEIPSTLFLEHHFFPKKHLDSFFCPLLVLGVTKRLQYNMLKILLTAKRDALHDF